MGSLASFHKLLAPIVGLSEAALYERQKALVRVGVLPKATGRGWASGGAKATPDNVAWVLLSILATDNLSVVSTEAPALARSKISRPIGPFQENETFLAAMTRALADPGIACYVAHVEATRKVCFGSIGWKSGRAPRMKIAQVSFVGERDAPPELGLSVRATLFGEDFFTLAEALESEK